MQGAAQFVAKHEPFHERPAIVRTIGSNREEFVPTPHQDHIFAADCSLKHPSIRKTVNHAVAEVWPNNAFPYRSPPCILPIHPRPANTRPTTQHLLAFEDHF